MSRLGIYAQGKKGKIKKPQSLEDWGEYIIEKL
jgi:hypothetical protein